MWTSKNSVYAFIGLVAFWINDDWELVECPIALIPVAGDHSGVASAKAIFKEFVRRGIVSKYSEFVCLVIGLFTHSNCFLPVAHAADNTSSNGTMTESLCHRIVKYLQSVQLEPNDCQVGCGCHVSNLTVQ